MNTTALKQHIPTFVSYWEKRQQAARNRLPKHLRPLAIWPIWLQLFLNVGIMMTLMTQMLNRDEYMTEAGPAIVMVICLVLLIYTMIEAFRMKARYFKLRGYRLAKLNFWMMVFAFLCWPAAVAVFLP